MKEATRKKVKLTKNQSLVLDTLVKAGRPLGAYSLLEALRDYGFKAPPQIYRALEHLIELKAVHRLESLNAWTACCSSRHEDTPIFEICDDCGSVAEYVDANLVRSIIALSHRNHFAPKHSIIEIHGCCKSCNIN